MCNVVIGDMAERGKEFTGERASDGRRELLGPQEFKFLKSVFKHKDELVPVEVFQHELGLMTDVAEVATLRLRVGLKLARLGLPLDEVMNYQIRTRVDLDEDIKINMDDQATFANIPLTFSGELLSDLKILVGRGSSFFADEIYPNYLERQNFFDRINRVRRSIYTQVLIYCIKNVTGVRREETSNAAKNCIRNQTFFGWFIDPKVDELIILSEDRNLMGGVLRRGTINKALFQPRGATLFEYLLGKTSDESERYFAPAGEISMELGINRVDLKDIVSSIREELVEAGFGKSEFLFPGTGYQLMLPNDVAVSVTRDEGCVELAHGSLKTRIEGASAGVFLILLNKSFGLIDREYLARLLGMHMGKRISSDSFDEALKRLRQKLGGLDLNALKVLPAERGYVFNRSGILGHEFTRKPGKYQGYVQVKTTLG